MVSNAEEDAGSAEPGTGTGNAKVAGLGVTDRISEFIYTDAAGERSSRAEFRGATHWVFEPTCTDTPDERSSRTRLRRGALRNLLSDNPSWKR